MVGKNIYIYIYIQSSFLDFTCFVSTNLVKLVLVAFVDLCHVYNCIRTANINVIDRSREREKPMEGPTAIEERKQMVHGPWQRSPS
jgi:hypothetical protein